MLPLRLLFSFIALAAAGTIVILPLAKYRIAQHRVLSVGPGDSPLQAAVQTLVEHASKLHIKPYVQHIMM